MTWQMRTGLLLLVSILVSMIGVHCSEDENFLESLNNRLSPGIIRMTPNTLNPAKFYQLRRSPTKNLTSSVTDELPVVPSVICTADEIGIRLNEHFGDVRIFASQKSGLVECTKRFSLEVEPEFVTRLDGPCGVIRKYKGVPSAGIEYHLRVIVSHDLEEITEYDKIYDLTCSHSIQNMELETFYDVIGFEANKLAKENDRSKPRCKYSLHQNFMNGPRTTTAKVGDVVFHKWSCYSRNSKHIFKVYNCQVQDENNRTYTIIDEHGCSMDDEIIPTPEYDVESGLIYTPSRAFRFASSNHVHFKCMISVCPKTDPPCNKTVPPRCKRTQKKRQLSETMTIEQRLLKIHELMNSKRRNFSGTIIKNDAFITVDPVFVARSAEGNNYESMKYEHVIRSYQLWTSILCILNISLVAFSILLSFRLFKNTYIMDIKDKANTVFRRAPF